MTWNGKIQQAVVEIESLAWRLKHGGVWTATATDVGDPVAELERVFSATVKLDRLAKYVIESGRVTLSKAMEVMETTDDDIVFSPPNAPVSGGGTPSAQVVGSRIFEPYNSIPCTCTDKCDDPCRGKCGCKSCHASYQDFLSNE